MTVLPVHRSRISFFALSAALVLTAACQKSSSGPAAETAAKPASSQPDHNAPITDPPVPPPVTANPLKGAKLFVDPEASVVGKANFLRKTDPEKAALLDKIAKQPQAMWMGEWNSNIYRAVDHFITRAAADGSVATIIAYNIPHRDAAAVAEGVGASAGGLASKDKYRRWIRDVYAGTHDRPVVIVLEPDALPGITSLPPDLQEERYFLFNDAVKVLRQNPHAAVYIDAGHGKWVPAKDMAERLKKAGVEHASGFSLNTSNYRTTEESVAYGKEISAMIGGKHFIVDTSRNGAGPYEGAKTITEMWCNPPGRRIGRPPTTETGEPLVDGYLWLKRPGESDGECERGEPKAGVFWLEQALEYAK
jgi:endoglucanase